MREAIRTMRFMSAMCQQQSDCLDRMAPDRLVDLDEASVVDAVVGRVETPADYLARDAGHEVESRAHRRVVEVAPYSAVSEIVALIS